MRPPSQHRSTFETAPRQHRPENFWRDRLALCLLWVTAATSLPAAESVHPNVVVILSDDQGWGDLSIHGNRNLSTPHIDSLARDGALFERFYVCPVCSPTRAEFLTGRYHPRGNVFNVSTGGERLDLDERTMADVFKSAGYATGAFGKWHNGTQYPYHPRGRGFDEYYGFCSGHWGHYFNPPLEHNGELVTGEGYMTDDLTTHAMDFIRQHRDQPFFCYVPYNTPHSPMQVPDQFYDKFRAAALPDRFQNPQQEELPMTRAALAMCENIDTNVGRILQLLDELQLADKTIVVYFSDNGPNSFRWNDGMKGRKGSTDEGGVRSPLLIRWPGQIPAGRRVPQIAGAIDLLPSLAALANVPVPSDRPLDGQSFVPWLATGNATPTDRLIFSHWAGKVSVRSQQYRLDAQGQLYDMTQDPGQTTDIAAQLPAVAQQLRSAVAEWKRDVLSQLERVERPFTVGYPQFPITHLPARDGLPHGKVERSGKAPNCSFFRNWTSVDDEMTWDVDIATEGQYAVTVYYAVPEKDVGSTIRWKLGDAELLAKVTEAHDPPLYGQEQDRVDRGPESYVKDFRPWNMGTMHLPAGPGRLSLQALQVTGAQVMEVRGVTLTLQSP